MSTRRAKQLIYGAFYLILWIGFFSGIYFLFFRRTTSAPPPPSCTFDCTPLGVAPFSLQGSVYKFVTSAGHYTFLAQIANINASYGSNYFGYSFDLYDASGTIIQSFPGATFIYGNQTKYVILPNQVITEQFDHVGLSIGKIYWASSTDLGLVPQFTFQNIHSSRSSSTVAIGGTLINNDVASFNAVGVIAIFKDAAGNPIGASRTEVDNLAPNAASDFSVIYPAVQNIDPANNQLVAYALRP